MDNIYRSDENQDEDLNLRTILDKYLIQWHWFVLAVGVSLIIAYTYLRYTTPQYQASTTVLVKDDRKGGMLSELSAFADIGLGGNSVKSNVDNEIEILKSRTLVESTVKRLKLNIGLFDKGNVITSEIYGNTPITVDFINVKPKFLTQKMVFELVELTPDTFTLENQLATDGKSLLLNEINEFKYGALVATQNGDLIITKSKEDKNQLKDLDKTISIVVSPIENVVASFQSRIIVNPISKTSSVVELSLTDPVIKKAEDFLNNLVQIYNDDAAADKNFISESTSKFIANRLILIREELEGVEQNVESFKRSNNLTDIQSEAQLFIEGSNEYNKKSVETEIQLNVVASMLSFMKNSSNADLLPPNIITGQGDANALISSYNQLVLERNRISKSATAANPSVIKLDQQMASLKSNVAESLGRLQATLNIQKRNLISQEGLLDTKIEKIPVQERQFRIIARQQKIKEELYLYLLQKREETAISLAATAPNARVVDRAKASKIPVAPKKNIIYLAALLLGLLIPFGILYLIDLLDTKVKTRFDITNKLNIPFLGDIPKSMTPNEIVTATSRTGTAEALRIIRTNLDFMLNQVPEGMAKTIFLTSTIPGEGKTFVSVNLGATFSLSGKKVLLIGMDIRNPKIQEYTVTPDNKGLTNYLSSNTTPISDYIHKLKGFDGLYVLPAGSIPPNPTELLMNNKIEELFVQLKKEYDFIIVDTAPVSLVSDTLLVAKHADTFVYIVRANYLDKRMLNLAEIMHKENKLPNMALLLNDTQSKKGYGYGYSYGYGYGYGYGVAEEKKPWYKTIFNK